MGDLFIRVGDKVIKKSRKPFKSGEKVATVKNVTVNPYTNRTAFSFIEDESVVDAHQCKKATESLLKLTDLRKE
jgi:hypothetical protein